MRLASIILSLIVTTSSAIAQETWVGFKLAEDVKLPFSDYIENSIVLIDTVGDTDEMREKGVEIVDISKIKRVKNPTKLAANVDPTTKQRNLKNIQIETCRKQSLRYCPVIKMSSISTGFFEDGKKLNTCRHAFHNWLVWASKANGNIPVETLSPPMILYTKDRRVIYNSAMVPNDQLAKFAFLNTDTRVNVLDFGVLPEEDVSMDNYRLSDVSQFEFKAELVKAQPVSYDLNMKNYHSKWVVYIAGYPGKTRFFSDRTLDAPGGKLVIASGHLKKISTKQQIAIANIVNKTGLSGSPAFTDKGDVIGLFCRGFSPKLDQPETAISYITVFDKQALQALWKSLQF